MTDPRAALNEVWAVFRASGVADDLAVIEHVAAVLLELRNVPKPAYGPWPEAYPHLELLNAARAQIRAHVSDAVAAAGPDNPYARVLDPYALFRPTRALSRGQYPTPRHIVGLMHRLAQVQAAHDLLDLACGSGGFLAHRPGGEHATGRSIGVEIALRWARIAAANTVLHLGPGHATVRQGNSIEAVVSAPELRNRFDRVLMNPPFGEKVQRGLLEPLEKAGFGELSGTSEVVLASLALRMLKESGRAAFLFPSGPLFGNGAAETALRDTMLGAEHHLRAVIALPLHAFQPYNQLQTHLLLVDRVPVQDRGRTWFFRLVQDGYPAGRGRDLTETGKEVSDFPLLEAALGVSPPSVTIDTGAYGDLLSHAWLVEEGAGGTPATGGVVVEARPDAVIEFAEWHPPPTAETADEPGFVLLVSISFSDAARTLVVYPGGKQVVERPNVDEWRKARYRKPSEDGEEAVTRQEWEESSPDPHVMVYDVRGREAERAGGTALVITYGGGLLGCTVPVDVVRDARDWQPETFLRAARPPEPQVSSGELLRRVRASQHEVARRLDALADSSGTGPRAASRPEPFTDPDKLVVFGELSPQQKLVYQAVCGLPLLPISEEGVDPYEVVPPFSVDQLAGTLAGQGVGHAAIESTLQILEGLGIVLRAHGRPAADAAPVPYFRLATPYDQPAPPPEDPAPDAPAPAEDP